MTLTIGGRGDYKVYNVARYGEMKMVEGAEHVVLQKRPTTKSEIIKKRDGDSEYRSALFQYLYCIDTMPYILSEEQMVKYKYWLSISMSENKYTYEYFDSIDNDELPR